MENLFNRTFTIGTTNELKQLCDEIYEGLNRQMSYANLRKWIKENGVRCARECWSESKGSVALFKWSMGKYRTNFKEI